jgi:hypothetical protein
VATPRPPAQQPRFAAHTAKLMRQLTHNRDFGHAAARAATAEKIHA